LQLVNGLAQQKRIPNSPPVMVTHPVVLLAQAYAAETLGDGSE